jgi:hypothetical protein
MIKDCDDKIIRNFDPQKDYLWLANPAKGRSGGILAGIKMEFYDVGAFYQGEFMLQMNLWDKINKLKWNLLVVLPKRKTNLAFYLSSLLSALEILILFLLEGTLTLSDLPMKEIKRLG